MTPALTDQQIQRFIRDGYIELKQAFPKELAKEGRDILWAETGCNPDDPATWTQPVIRLGDHAQAPFRKAVNTPLLQAAFDQLVGAGNWLPRESLGTFPIRFPSAHMANDTGWHVDAGFPGDAPEDFLSWRINVYSRGRALLMLLLFSDVGVADAPTRIRAGSHLDVARLLEPAGEAGLSFGELSGQLHRTDNRREVLATGAAGTVYLCHPFIVHAAQPHMGAEPRFLAQPPLYPAYPFQLQRSDGRYCPVERAIRTGIGLE